MSLTFDVVLLRMHPISSYWDALPALPKMQTIKIDLLFVAKAIKNKTENGIKTKFVISVWYTYTGPM